MNNVDSIIRVRTLDDIECPKSNVLYLTKNNEVYILSYDKQSWLLLYKDVVEKMIPIS